MTDKSTLDLISEIDEFQRLSGMMEDGELDTALSAIVKLIMKPDIPPQAATQLIIQLQAISSKFAILATFYKNVEPGKAGTQEYKKKNVYFTMHECLNELVAALKYNIRGSNG